MSAKAMLILAMLLLLAVLFLMAGCVSPHTPLEDSIKFTAEECQKITYERVDQEEQKNKAPILNAVK